MYTSPYKGIADSSRGDVGGPTQGISPDIPKSSDIASFPHPTPVSDKPSAKEANSCYLCHGKNTKEMVQCDYCEKWAHGKCELLSAGDLATFTRHKNLPYTCCGCRGGVQRFLKSIGSLKEKVTTNTENIQTNRENLESLKTEIDHVEKKVIFDTREQYEEAIRK